MAILLGIDLGTSTITALALDASDGRIIALSTTANDAQITSAADKSRGYCEWDSTRIVAKACSCLRTVAGQLESRCKEIEGIGITGQQHGVVVLDPSLIPATAFVNWQDRRGEDTFPGANRTFVSEALARVGTESTQRTGCRLATGYLAVTLFWLKEHGLLPLGTACFLMDYFGAVLTGRPPVTDPTCAASSGVLDIRRQQWDEQALSALGLSRGQLPEVRPSGTVLGGLAPGMATATGLPAGVPIFVGLGDNQASFLGSAAQRDETILVNVGTGGQVTTYTPAYAYDPFLETRPYPGEGYLLVSAGLSGGTAYALLERFYRQVASQVFHAEKESAFRVMNELAGGVQRGADGLRCEPFFSGTRTQPELRGSFTGISVENLTPAHLARALLEGMARAMHSGYREIERVSQATRTQLVGSGNGIRENAVFTRVVADAFAMPVSLPLHREEAAYGAALLVGVGAEIFSDLPAASRLIRYEPAL